METEVKSKKRSLFRAMMTSSSTGEICVAKFFSSVAAVITLFKYATSDIAIPSMGIAATPFDASAAALILATFGALYSGREWKKASGQGVPK